MSPCCRTSATYSQVNPTPRWGSKRCSVQTDLHYTVAPITSKLGMRPEGCLSSFLTTVQQRAQGSCPEASWDVPVAGIRMGNTPSSPTGLVWTWLQLCSPVIWCHLWPTSICKLFSEPCLTLSSFFLAFSSCVIVLLLSAWGRLVVSSFLPSLLIFTPSRRSWHFCLNASFFFPLGSKADWNWLKQFVLPWQGDVKTKHVCLLVLNQDFFSCSFPSFLFNRHSETGSWSKKSNPSLPGECHPDNTSSLFSKTLPVLLNLLKHAPASNRLTNLNLSFPPSKWLGRTFIWNCICHLFVSQLCFMGYLEV